MSQPDAVAEVIIEAAVNASKEKLILN